MLWPHLGCVTKNGLDLLLQSSVTEPAIVVLVVDYNATDSELARARELVDSVGADRVLVMMVGYEASESPYDFFADSLRLRLGVQRIVAGARWQVTTNRLDLTVSVALVLIFVRVLCIRLSGSKCCPGGTMCCDSTAGTDYGSN